MEDETSFAEDKSSGSIGPNAKDNTGSKLRGLLRDMLTLSIVPLMLLLWLAAVLGAFGEPGRPVSSKEGELIIVRQVPSAHSVWRAPAGESK
jgi:hypothetical protein